MLSLPPLVGDILTEDAILKWYQDAHIAKGKREFISQMKYMIDWFSTAEEESDEGQTEASAEQLSWPTSNAISYLQHWTKIWDVYLYLIAKPCMHKHFY